MDRSGEAFQNKIQRLVSDQSRLERCKCTKKQGEEFQCPITAKSKLTNTRCYTCVTFGEKQQFVEQHGDARPGLMDNGNHDLT